MQVVSGRVAYLWGTPPRVARFHRRGQPADRAVDAPLAGLRIFLASNVSSYLTGTTIFADAGWTVIDGRFEPQLKSYRP